MPAPRKFVRSVQLISAIWLATGVAPQQSAQARAVRPYTHAELVSKSDAVVIAFALATEGEADRELDKELRGLERHVECVTTSFQIEAIVKGDIKADRLSLLHYRFKPVANPIHNAPGLVRFETQGRVYGRELVSGKPVRGSPPKYLLFLKATADGKFVPVTGQMDPDGSVKRLESADKDEQRRIDP